MSNHRPPRRKHLALSTGLRRIQPALLSSTPVTSRRIPAPSGCFTRTSVHVLTGLFWLLVCLSSTQVSHGQLGHSGAFLSRSVSGQFIIQPAPLSFGSPLRSLLENDTNFVRLDPGLLTVSCERIKQLIWRQLNVPASWNGKIFLRLYQASSPDNPIAIDAEHFGDGWQYRVSLPDLCHRERYVRAVVSVLLLELANRSAYQHSAEVPLWLREGLSREIWTSDQKEVILPLPQFSGGGLRMTTLLVNARRENPLELAHRELCEATPLSFQQLSWPMPDPQTGEPGEVYRASAQLFVHQLLGIPDGPACVRSMIQNLPRFFNWQFAFQDAFHLTFPRMLDVEKWWSLQLVHFTGRELSQNWTAGESWQKLDSLVRSAVQLRVGTNELPLHAEVLLQTIIRDWPVARQTPALECKLSELQMLRPRLSKDLASIAEDYCRTIEAYLQEVKHPGSILPFHKHALLRRGADATLQHLDQLDARRAELRPPEKSSARQTDVVTNPSSNSLP